MLSQKQKAFQQSFGVPASLVHSGAEVEQALRQSLDHNGPIVIEVPVGPMKRVY